ncbi:hypothetical protein CEK25_012313 [Fusarium fujikuroi]|nr:hypothetical protein CEK25_012313 [Fusarium fujikuroi]
MWPVHRSVNCPSVIFATHHNCGCTTRGTYRQQLGQAPSALWDSISFNMNSLSSSCLAFTTTVAAPSAARTGRILARLPGMPSGAPTSPILGTATGSSLAWNADYVVRSFLTGYGRMASCSLGDYLAGLGVSTLAYNKNDAMGQVLAQDSRPDANLGISA